MNRTVRRQLIDSWIDAHSPYGITELSKRAKVSNSLIDKARLGKVPAKQGTRVRLCKALGVKEDDLFPFVGADGEEQAS